MSLKGKYLLIIALCSALLAALMFTALRLGQISDELNTIRRASLEAVAFAAELKQSSDDLTRMARTYAATGEPVYRHYFEQIAAIRDGRVGRPDNYGPTYWDQVTSGNLAHAPGGPALSLLDKYHGLNLTQTELARLAYAKAKSDELIGLEEQAFAHVALGTDAGRREAQAVLYGVRYHAAKAKIMAPIAEFTALLQTRLERTEKAYVQEIYDLKWVAAMLVSLSVVVIFWGFYYFLRFVVLPLGQLSDLSARIRAGDYSQRAQVSRSTSQDEVATLSIGINEMLDAIDLQTSRLQESMVKAEAANRAKSAFIANMSHELRTPLNAVLGFAQLLERDPGLDPGQLSYVRSIRSGGDYLLTLINDILDLARIEAGRVELFPVHWNTHSFFDGLFRLFEITAKKKGIDFRYERLTPLPAVLECDEKRLRQILVNLLGNAIKFTNQGCVVLRSGLEGGRLLLEVEDTGSGIAADQHEQIFEPFTQSGSDTQRMQGTGLGLAISHRLLLAMGGELTLESEPGVGSRFHLELPVNVVDHGGETERPASTSPPSVRGYRRTRGEGALRLLLVDDVAENRRVLRDFLEPLGFTIDEAANGNEALREVAEMPPDLVLMDLRMPDMDGLEATRRLRGGESGVRLPIIALSAAAFGDDLERSRAAGCDEHLAKPLDLKILLDSLARHLPVVWLDDETATEESAPRPGPALSAQQRDELLHLLRLGKVMVLRTYLESLSLQPDCPVLVPELQGLLRGFRVREAVALIQRDQASGDDENGARPTGQ